MLSYLTCRTPKRFIRIAWISRQPKGDISFGISDKSYISPEFRARQFVWNAYNRVVAQYEIANDPKALDPVRNPHFTFHFPNYFHLKSDKAKAKKDEALFAGLCDVPIVLMQQDEMPWIRARTAPLSQLKSAGVAWSKVPTNDLPLMVESEDASLEISVDLIRPEAVPVFGGAPPWAFKHDEVGLRIDVTVVAPRIASLSWFHSA
jgi:hypothetical protein